MAGGSRQLLEERKLDEVLFAKICELLPAGGIQLLGGAIADERCSRHRRQPKCRRKAETRRCTRAKKHEWQYLRTALDLAYQPR